MGTGHDYNPTVKAVLLQLARTWIQSEAHFEKRGSSFRNMTEQSLLECKQRCISLGRYVKQVSTRTLKRTAPSFIKDPRSSDTMASSLKINTLHVLARKAASPSTGMNHGSQRLLKAPEDYFCSSSQRFTPAVYADHCTPAGPLRNLN